MIFLRRWLLVLSLLVWGGGSLLAADFREERAYAAAVNAFQTGMWGRAQTQLAQFIKNFPASTNVPEARLLQAQTYFKQQAYGRVAGLLTTNLTAAGGLADQYVYWIGEAQFQAGDFPQAADTFNSLAQKYPESSLRLRAVVESAAALARNGQPADWTAIVTLLEAPDGVFQTAAQTDLGNDVARGKMLLAQAKFALKDFAGASAVLDGINPQTLPPALDWQRIYLLCQVKLAAGETNAALAASTNLLHAVQLDRDAASLWNLSDSVALRADVLEKLGRTREALAVYQQNLTTGAPAGRQQQAILKMAALAADLNQFGDATNALETFLDQFPDSPAADLALVTLGELELKALAGGPPDTNRLAAAQARFDQFFDTFTNSPLTGRAYLDRGWCFWLAGKVPESAADFSKAVEKLGELPRSELLAVAKFKLGDALFYQRNFPGALENYLAVWEDFADLPAVAGTLGDRALYQSLRADLELGDLDSASNVLAQIQKNYDGSRAENSALLFGESWAELRSPPGARAQFAQIAAQYPGSTLAPQVTLAIARTYELETNWPAVITNYAGWLAAFPTNALRPQVAYALAQATYRAGEETNALGLFTNFLARYPTNALAPVAQWWVADHFFRAGLWPEAERNYKAIFQNTDWQAAQVNQTNLFYSAQMMAGRAALGRLGYSDALGYFTGLMTDSNCPPAWAVPARFAYGCTLMLMNSTDTNNPLANFQLATNANAFGRIVQDYPTNDWGAQAMIQIGNCDLQLNDFDGAAAAYTQVFSTNSLIGAYAQVGARSQAQIGLGIALEKKAALASGAESARLLDQALDNYTDVLFLANLRPGESWDAFWRKKAGLQAAAVAETLGNYAVAVNIYQQLENILPPLQAAMDKKIAAARTHLPAGSN